MILGYTVQMKFDLTAESVTDLTNTLVAEREQIPAGSYEHLWKVFPEELTLL